MLAGLCAAHDARAVATDSFGGGSGGVRPARKRRRHYAGKWRTYRERRLRCRAGRRDRGRYGDFLPPRRGNNRGGQERLESAHPTCNPHASQSGGDLRCGCVPGARHSRVGASPRRGVDCGPLRDMLCAICGRVLGEEAMAATRVVKPDRLIDGDETVELIGRPLRLIAPQWSSAPGAIAVFDEQTSTLIAGNLVVGQPNSQSARRQPESLARGARATRIDAMSTPRSGVTDPSAPVLTSPPSLNTSQRSKVASKRWSKAE